MKKYLNKKAILICLGIAAIIAVISIIVPLIKPKKDTTNKDGKKYTTLYTMNDKSMAYDEAYFIAKYRQGYYEYNYYMSNPSFKWDDYLVDIQMTREELILDELDAYLKEIFILSEYALDNGLGLTENEEKAVISEVNSFLSDNDAKMISATKATEELATRVITRTTLHSKVCEDILKDKDLTIDPEDARICTVGVATINSENFDSPERVANEILERIGNGDLLGELSKIYGAPYEKGYVSKDSESNNKLNEFCLSLKDNESKMIEIDGTYYIVYCYLENDEVETSAKKELLLEEKKQAYITAFVEELLKENTITVDTKAWESINFDTPVYTKDDVIKSE